MNKEESHDTPFKDIINKFKGKQLPSDQIESDYNNTLNYPNNYFIAPKDWKESFYTTSRKKMLLLSRGLENIVRVKPPFNKFTLISLFQKANNFEDVKNQYIEMSSLTRKLYLIGPDGLASGIKFTGDTEIIDSTDLGLDNNWLVFAISNDEGCGLVAEEVQNGIYRGFFTTNQNLVLECLRILDRVLPKNLNVEY